MGEHACEDINTEYGQREDKQIEVTIVPPSHAVPHPGTVVVKPLWNTKQTVIEVSTDN